VVVVEDAHWADEATLDLLVFLGRRLERTPVMLIVTYRDDELGADHPLRGVLGALPQRVAHRVRPQPLSEAAVAELARRAGRPAAGLRCWTAPANAPTPKGSRSTSKAEMLELVRRFNVADDDTMVLPMDYLEAIIYKPATP
jgi:hypothetical protein